ncbi:MAG TPA: hypothetical protein PKZ35_09245 [Gammaproteobacteria bacterium]|nr:hypothetical protein [Gammaproteobacteria bacterium]
MISSYNAADFRKHRDWVAEHGGDLFPTIGAFEWFVRQHRQELINSGELIVRRGPGGTLVGPNFGRLAITIVQRESRERGAA